MITKLTTPIQSRQASVIPGQRNGCLTHQSSSTLCTPLRKTKKLLTKTDSTDTFEMQILAHQRQTLDAFHELEQLVPNGVPDRAAIVQMSSIVQDQDNLSINDKQSKKNRLKTKFNSNHS